ncbi:SAM-dependent DNA methyltransferase [Brevibacillus sp. SYP-B805]|uniref:class I SAM-dependent DNA methyltransferase n=1 Tax=Brevibacillus sp. SYP-B805 TaxID=1578199 RepID=UPI0013EABC53|nr:class I SAM-dependent DNA methyltransferase [Brevibacillus sp. SYP-B805]NGQ95920.1 SAM-dependent DNA methyltransferase [Brevibacillus sp. SYP-B805]
MLTGEIRHRVDAIWEIFWTGGITNPLTVIEQFTYLLFLKRLDEKEGVLEPGIRWSGFAHKEADDMFRIVKDEVFPRLKRLGGKNSRFARHLENAVFLIPSPVMLQRIVTAIDRLVGDLPAKNQDALGDLYEYLLAKLSTSGTNGQFRTPRHIIRMMVQLMKPTLQDTILDPAAGTAGFLVEAADYVAGTYRDQLSAESGTPALQQHFRQTMFYGFDTDPTMLRIASMNLLLHGMEDPNIFYRDVLAEAYTEEEKYSLVLANPPFKGSIDGSRVSASLLAAVKTKKTELLFLALILRVLKTGGRCAVIVPDGVLFGSSKAHVAIRQLIVDRHRLEAVISLPAGVFRPYAGVSTAILIFTKTNCGGTERVWFYDMLADGYSLDDHRRQLDPDKHEENNIPDILARFANLEAERSRARTEQSFLVEVGEIRANRYDLSINRYKQRMPAKKEYPPPGQILQEIAQLEDEIADALRQLKEMIG